MSTVTRLRNVLSNRIFAGLVMIGPVFLGCSKPQRGDSDDATKASSVVKVAKVVRKSIRQMVSVNGVFVPGPGAEAKLGPEIAGRITQVLVEEGASVRKGDLLATVDTSVVDALGFTRGAKSGSSGAGTRLAEIRAPYDGRITRRYLNPGDSADIDTPIVEIIANHPAKDFVGSALAMQLSKVALGQQAIVDPSDHPVNGRVVNVAPADSQTGLGSVRIACEPGGVVGVYSTAQIVLGATSQAVAVPDAALLNRDGKVMVLRDVDGAAKETEVQVGPSDGGFTQIVSGLSEGDDVITEGAYELEDGAKVTPQAAPGTKADDKKEPDP